MIPPTPFQRRCEATLRALEARGILRRETPVERRPTAATIVVEGRELVNLSSNDYLGLSMHPALAAAACDAARAEGCGSAASRLVCGGGRLHEELEERLRRWLGAEAVLVVGSGYLANVGAPPALAAEGELIFSDRLNHASIIDGCRLSGARTVVYPHADAARLEALLDEPARGGGRAALVVTESTFSMDGDEAPLGRIDAAAAAGGAALLVDEAHSFGVKGAGGRGCASLLPAGRGERIVMGTLGKAAGAYGAFIASSAVVRELLVNRMRSVVFSTALPPPALAAALAGVGLLAGDEGEALRARLRANCAAMREALAASGWSFGGVEGPIFPLAAPGPRRALDAQRRLAERGFFVKAVRWPTVPEGSERLRLVVGAALSDAHVEEAGAALKEAAP